MISKDMHDFEVILCVEIVKSARGKSIENTSGVLEDVICLDRCKLNHAVVPGMARCTMHKEYQDIREGKISGSIELEIQ